MKQFGSPIVGYEGVAVVSLEEGDKRTENKGYYEAAQFPSGRLVVTFMPTDWSRPTEVSLTADPDGNLSLNGNDVDGWTVKSAGQAIFSSLMWQIIPISTLPSEFSFGTQYLVASCSGASEEGYNGAQFLLSNFLWHDRNGRVPEPLKMRALDFDVVVAPMDDYLEKAQRLARTHGIEPTARVSVEIQQGGKMHMQGFADFMDDLVYTFRLLTGNLVDWYYGEAVQNGSDKPVERIHKYAVTGPYSNTIQFRALRSGYQSLVPKVDIAEFTAAFFNDAERVLGRAALKPLINQLTNACADTLYLESRGMLASTLIELIAAKYAHAKGGSEVIPKRDFETNILPKLKEAVGNVAIARRAKDKIKSHLQGAYRSSLRRKLQQLNKGENVGLSYKDISRIVNVRNELVHEGTYGSNVEDGGWIADYTHLIWASLVALCRLTGYRGQLPQLREGFRLEV